MGPRPAAMHHLGACEGHQTSGPTSHLQNQNLWGWATARLGLPRTLPRGFGGRPKLLSVWIRPAGRVSPGVGGGAWGLGTSEQLLYKEDPFLGVPAGGKCVGACLRNR